MPRLGYLGHIIEMDSLERVLCVCICTFLLVDSALSIHHIVTHQHCSRHFGNYCLGNSSQRKIIVHGREFTVHAKS